MGVVKNIIPAIASTNALISAACVTEVIKIMSGCNNVLDNYMQYMGQTSISTFTYPSGRNDDCIVCSNSYTFKVAKNETLASLIERLKTEKGYVNPGLNDGNCETIYAPPPLE